MGQLWCMFVSGRVVWLRDGVVQGWEVGVGFGGHLEQFGWLQQVLVVGTWDVVPVCSWEWWEWWVQSPYLKVWGGAGWHSVQWGLGLRKEWVSVCGWGLVAPLALGKAGSLLGVGWVVALWLVSPLAFIKAGSFLGVGC